MAEAVLEIVLENLSSLVQKELSLFLGFDQNFENLSSLLTTIKATLKDAEEKQFTDRAIKDWLQKLKGAVHVLDDILDECATQALELEYERIKGGPSGKVQSSCLSSFHPKHVAFRHRIAKKMKKIKERLDKIDEERSKFHLTEIVRERRSRVLDWRETTSTIAERQVYGRDEDKGKIVDFLVREASESEDLSVYPIVGLGGLGKTTLAQLIFNDERIVNHFELRIWVCVSVDFSLKRMTKAIIESASGPGCPDSDLEPLKEKLQDLLQRKRYLLVLDDVWDDKQYNWQGLRSILACGGKGASVLVTTRLLQVATITGGGKMPPHDLSKLSYNDCWELFKQRAFGLNVEERAELVVLGKEIVKKCGGVPLAAITLGSLLSFKGEETGWRYVKESKLWDLQDADLQDENSIMPALKLSYLNLPVKLRQCFAICALFPKDQIISKQYLIELWMANGFISSNNNMEAEDIGNEVWNELYWRSFFQDVEVDEFGKVTGFKMHDLVHDLAQCVSEEVCCFTKENDVSGTRERIFHLSIYHPKVREEPSSFGLPNAKSLKTCITFVNYFQLSPHVVLKCHSLRVLDFERSVKLPSSIGRLKHLRYLNLSRGEFKTLPESICKLWNLQILKLNCCHDLQKLPHSLIHLKALRHLSLKHCDSLSSLPPKIGKLTSLRTLSMYIVGKKRGSFLAELGQLNLRGNLDIEHLERVRSVMDAKEANMSSKRLNHLCLLWERNEESQIHKNVEEIIEVLQPQTQQLRTLLVRGYTGAHFPQWMSSPSLKYLNSLQLSDCNSCLHLPKLGKLPSLKKLSICNMRHVIYLDEECYDGGAAGGFMALTFLHLDNLPNLKRLSREEGENMFPRLFELNIFECPNLLGLPCLPSLNDMCVRGKCKQDLLSSIHKLHRLESLQFEDNEALTCFPDGMLQNLTSMKTLIINRLSKLEQLPAEISIQEIKIISCKNLKSLKDEVLQGLQSLKKLEIKDCPKFKLSAGFQYLTSLEELVIESCPGTEDLHEALQHMTALQSLKLRDLPNLASLPDWLGNLSSLHKLIITKCWKLTCFPMSIQCLTGLKSLEIYGCSELGRRCEKETGEDWPKIAHIQDIKIRNRRA